MKLFELGSLASELPHIEEDLANRVDDPACCLLLPAGAVSYRWSAKALPHVELITTRVTLIAVDRHGRFSVISSRAGRVLMSKIPFFGLPCQEVVHAR
jgi:hypothetical protein